VTIPLHFGKEAGDSASFPGGGYKYTATATCELCGKSTQFSFISGELPLSESYDVGRQFLTAVHGYAYPLFPVLEREARRFNPDVTRSQMQQLFGHLYIRRTMLCRECAADAKAYVRLYYASRALSGNVTKA